VQQEVIRLLIDHIVVEKNAITIKHIIPTDDDCRLLPGRRFAQIHTDEKQKNLRKSVLICDSPEKRSESQATPLHIVS